MPHKKDVRVCMCKTRQTFSDRFVDKLKYGEGARLLYISSSSSSNIVYIQRGSCAFAFLLLPCRFISLAVCVFLCKFAKGIDEG